MASPLPDGLRSCDAGSLVAGETTQGARRHQVQVRRKGDTTSQLQRGTIRGINCRKTGRISPEAAIRTKRRRLKP
jgi:hypothetical protein